MNLTENFKIIMPDLKIEFLPTGYIVTFRALKKEGLIIQDQRMVFTDIDDMFNFVWHFKEALNHD